MTTTKCVHHWKLDTPAGPTSKGVCALCGATQHFPNSFDMQGHYTEDGHYRQHDLPVSLIWEEARRLHKGQGQRRRPRS